MNDSNSKRFYRSSSKKPLLAIDDAEKLLSGVTLEEGEWRFGAVNLVGGAGWHVFVQLDAHEFDVLVEGSPMTKDEAIAKSFQLAQRLGGTMIVPGGEA